jgi:hypothetical protein
VILGVRSAAVLALASTVASDAPGGAAAPTDLLGILIQSGPFALFLGLIIIDKIAPTGERNRLREEVKEYKADMAQLNKTLLEVLPPLTELLPVLRTLVMDRVEEHDPPPTPYRGR